ncbi:amino acid/polyamine/organocation transporter, APC superfamily (TC 2.A.3) [Geodermatophilus dictyosporus]|uniref:Amino acid/polyamine/organocation transporter, APC superfamily (TC 2.A.3) n=1 Tax=Geodermatophilus dictyosporus TaxID=1523247 RepID=A0A1I5JNC3_9ACTN|nr:APC family permease [Geodermatophilus dictyosporus]SFO74304.1 amino acid/polyamine/organocation transporter, APC superfamily (TC 2.A.3) [Geodermatophilus dictyosporus]
MAETSTRTVDGEDSSLRRSITGGQLFFYTLGDVLGSGIYVLIGLVAAAVGGAFWIAFALGVTVAAITGAAYAELVTKYPQAAGAALYVKKAFGSTALTFLVTVSFLSASFAATGSLATGFASYFATLWAGPPALLVSLVFVLALVVVNFIGITESVVMNMLMTFVEVAGLVIVVVIGIWYVAQGNADFGVLADISVSGNPALAVLAGIAFSFFAMTGFENTANVAEETIDPHRSFPRSLVGGMVVAGTVYVLVSMAAALTVPTDVLAESDAALLEVVKQGILPFSTGVMETLFSVIALIAITNTTLVTIVTQPRILYGMAREDVVPGVFAKVHATRRSPWVGLLFSAAVVAGLLVTGSIVLEAGGGIDLVNRLALVTVVLLLGIYALVIVACLKLRGRDEHEHTYRANTPLLVVGLVGNLAILGFSIYDDPSSLIWCAALIAIGVVLFLVEYAAGSRNRPPGTRRGDPEAASRRDA